MEASNNALEALGNTMISDHRQEFGTEKPLMDNAMQNFVTEIYELLVPLLVM